LNAAGVQAVQGWVDGGSNNGLVLVTTGSTDGVDITSREGGSTAALEVNFESGTAGLSAWSNTTSATTLAAPGTGEQVTLELRDGESGYTGTQDGWIAGGRPDNRYDGGTVEADDKSSTGLTGYIHSIPFHHRGISGLNGYATLTRTAPSASTGTECCVVPGRSRLRRVHRGRADRVLLRLGPLACVACRLRAAAPGES
jgi:hypothetical protein